MQDDFLYVLGGVGVLCFKDYKDLFVVFCVIMSEKNITHGIMRERKSAQQAHKETAFSVSGGVACALAAPR